MDGNEKKDNLVLNNEKGEKYNEYFFAEKKAEAVARMKMLRLYPDVIREFESNRSIMCFDGSLGIAMKLGKKEMQQVRKLEEDKDILVYAILYGEYNIGNMAACLYVSSNQHEWERAPEH